MPSPKITPTQELVLDTLAARYRLGYGFWPVFRAHARALNGLAELGLVTLQPHSASPRHFSVALTEAGKKLSGVSGVSLVSAKKSKTVKKMRKLLKQFERDSL
jgi:hypothetical protein